MSKPIYFLVSIITIFTILFVVATLIFSIEPQKEGNPADSLPPHITHLISFGERPDWRHDGRRIVFLSRTFGDVYEYEISSGRIAGLRLRISYPLTMTN